MLKHGLLLSSKVEVLLRQIYRCYPYYGNGTTQTVENGINTNVGSLVLTKVRSTTGPILARDTFGHYLNTTTTDTEHATPADTINFLTNGYELGSASGTELNINGEQHASWTFRRAARFFDMVTYTGDGQASKTVNHSLTIEPGMIVCKSVDTTATDWFVYHKDATGDLALNTAGAQSVSKDNINTATSTTFNVGSNANQSGVGYVAYVFAHDSNVDDGLIQCGTFTTDVSGNADVTLGWEPQTILWKRVDDTGSWNIFDNQRRWGSFGDGGRVRFNDTTAETDFTTAAQFDSDGFSDNSYATFGPSATHVYLVIRKRGETPSSTSEVFDSRTRVGAGGGSEWKFGGLDFAPDMTIISYMSTSSNYQHATFNREVAKTDKVFMHTSSQTNPTWTNGGHFHDTDGFYSYYTGNILDNYGKTYSVTNFKAAPGFFDLVGYTGDGASTRTHKHRLGIVPRLIVIRGLRDDIGRSWHVLHADAGTGLDLYFDIPTHSTGAGSVWDSQLPTADEFYTGSDVNINRSGEEYMVWLFGELPGLTKIGSYTGNGTSQTIDCGFVNGAQYVWVKRYDVSAPWYCFDIARGISQGVGNNPHFDISSSSAQDATADSLWSTSSGFDVNQNATTDLNVDTAEYVFFAIAQ